MCCTLIINLVMSQFFFIIKFRVGGRGGVYGIAKYIVGLNAGCMVTANECIYLFLFSKQNQSGQ